MNRGNESRGEKRAALQKWETHLFNLLASGPEASDADANLGMVIPSYVFAKVATQQRGALARLCPDPKTTRVVRRGLRDPRARHNESAQNGVI
jgi:hypothetical protein